MTAQEYRDFVGYLYGEYVAPRLHRVRMDFPLMDWREDLGWTWERLKDSMDVLNYIRRHCDSGEPWFPPLEASGRSCMV